jgi:hypothetical protein
MTSRDHWGVKASRVCDYILILGSSLTGVRTSYLQGQDIEP